MPILRSNGRQYTTAAQDLRVNDLKSKFRRVLEQEITHAMQVSKNGKLEMHMEAIEAVIEAAYLMGREDAS